MQIKAQLAFILTVACLHGSQAHAANLAAHAKVVLLPAIQIDEQNEIDFGTLSNVDGTCQMAADGSLSGTEGMSCTGTETPGQFTISGQNDAIINLAVATGEAAGITFTPVIDGNSSRALENGSTQITILGSLTLNNASEGANTISYTLTANYE